MYVTRNRSINRGLWKIALFLPVFVSAGVAQQPNTSARHQAAVAVSNRQLIDPEVERRARALLQQMTLDEKLGQLVQYSDEGYTAATDQAQGFGWNPKGKDQVGAMQLAEAGKVGSILNLVGAGRTNALQHAAVEKSRLHIPLLFGADILHGFRTVYPEPLGLAATFDPELVERLSRISAEEATTAGVRWFYSPMVDISRDPRWGRTAEGAGEDAYLGSAMAAAYVRGYQGDDLSHPDSVAACVKHFAAYGAAEAGRDYNTMDMSEIRLRQDYLPPYHAAVEAGAATVMSAFNALNGVPATANPFLMHKVLRDEWGFDGFVVSDYAAIDELRDHGVALDAATATRKAIRAGTDVDMMSHFYDVELPRLIRTRQVPMSVVNDAVLRVLRVKIALGLFEHPYATGTEVTAPVEAHRALARQGAEESFVLLQNQPISNGVPILPLAPGVRKIALIGPLASSSQAMIGGDLEETPVSGTDSLLTALTTRAKMAGATVTYAKGTDVIGISDEGFAAAVSAAKEADVAVLALGETGDMSGEAGSRAHLGLPGNQKALLDAIAATGRPVILLIFSGRPLVLTNAVQHTTAILEAWSPGTEGGSAIAAVLFGDAVPSGKLPMSFPRAVGQEPLYYNHFPTGRPADGIDLTKPPTGDTRFFSRYIDVPNDPLFPFGFGLSYTTFAYSGVTVSRSSIPLREVNHSGAKQLLVATATVTNTGGRTATDVVQCYVRNRGASVEQPVRSLKGFERVTLRPGESKSITFWLGFAELSFYSSNNRAQVAPTEYTVWIGDSSQATKQAQFRITP